MVCMRLIIGLVLILKYSLARGTICNSTPVNPCLGIRNYCYNVGTCYFDKTTCQYKCHCAPLFRGRRCEERKVDQGEATTPGTPASEISLSGTTSPSVTAISPSATATSLNGTTSSPSGKGPSPSGTGPSPSGTGPSPSGTATSSSGKFTSAFRLARHPRSADHHVCSPKYEKWPMDERKCLVGFVCRYGRCKHYPDDSFECMCDEGGIGYECEEKCCLQCSEHGVCEKSSNGTEVCHCETNYEGKFCNKTIFDTGAATSPDDKAAVVPPRGITYSPSGRVTSQTGNVTSQSGATSSPIDNVTLDVQEGAATLPSSGGKTNISRDTISTLSGTASSHSNTTSSSTSTAMSRNDTNILYNRTTESPTDDEPEMTSFPDLDPTFSANPTEIHVCSPNYTMRPYEERYCFQNFVCRYGRCKHYPDASAECECDKGGIGDECEEKCCLQCSHNGFCEKPNGTEVCHCPTNYEGRLCESLIPSDDTPERDVEELPIWVIPIALVILLLVAAGLFFWMWRNRVTIIMKIVHYFQAYEDDDEKIWDVFISYKSADVDQDFVLHVLMPKLEELGFTVCLHFREFLPGEPIANNIINAIIKSRRTILILTPRYISSEFTRLEYQVAQHEMLKRKHKIVPVLLEDISVENDIMDPNLKHILRCVTYLEYPGHHAGEKDMKRFWEKLSLALPKKRRAEEKQNPPGEMTTEENREGEINTTPAAQTGTVDTHV